MKIGTIKEIKNNENRVALTPEGTKKLTKQNHDVFIETNAGLNAGFPDLEYKKAGAKILKSPLAVIKKVDLLLKVKEPLKEEYKLLNNFKNKTLFTYLHLAAAPKELTLNLIKNKITAIAYETVEGKKDRLPLLKPMSIVAGTLAVQYGAEYLQLKYGGRGVTLGNIPNTENANVVVIGGGTVGSSAALMAATMGCNVTVFQRRKERVNQLKIIYKNHLGNFNKNIQVKESLPKDLAKKIKKADLVIGSVLIKGAKAPRIITKEMVQSMKKGSVIIDVAIDQGGCIWGSKPTTHTKPIYKKEGKIYCNIPNMPGQVARQSTQALTNATLPYIIMLTNNQFNFGLNKGINVEKGRIKYKAIAEDLNLMQYYQK